MKTTVTLSPKDVEDIVKQYLTKRFKEVSEIKMEVRQELRGNGMHEYYAPTFKGIRCEVEM